MTKINPERLAMLESINLRSGSHDSFDDGVCAMEMVAYLAGLPHSDKPECTCPVLATFVRSWNDGLPDADRNRLLKPILPALVNTRSTPEVEKARGFLALDWLIREYLPMWLETMDDLHDHAAKLRAHAEIVSDESAALVMDDVMAARSATGYAADSAADSAAGSAAGSAASWAAYWAADSAADSAADWATYWATRLAAEAALAPTVAKLQDSAVNLIERMIAVEVAL